MQAPTISTGGMMGPTNWEVDPAKQTVGGMVQSVIANDSPLMQQARSRSMQSMNGRGLVNSSMAAGAGESAVYDHALQIATPDAATYANAAQTNAAAKNVFSNNQNQYTQQNKQAEYQTAANEWGAQQEFGRTTQRDATQQGYAQSNMAQQQGHNMQTLGAQQGFQGGQSALDRTQQTAMADKQQGFNLQTIGVQNNYQSAREALDRAQQIAMADKSIGAQQSLQSAQQTFQQAQSALDRTQQATMLDKQAAIAKDVAGIEAQYKNLTQGSASAASIVTKMQDALSLITANKDITDPAKRDAAIADVKANAAEALALIGAMSGDLDLREYVQSISNSAYVPASAPVLPTYTIPTDANQLRPAAPVAW